jgi:hypothetical protein
VLQQLRISVGRTWRLTTSGTGRATASVDLRSYKNEDLNGLKGAASSADFGLPWPEYRSTFWRAMLGKPYDNVATRDLVALLLPARRESPLGATVVGARCDPRLEVLRHPFAITTIAHFDLADVALASEQDAAQHLDDFLRQPLGATGGEVRDGAPLDWAPQGPDRDADEVAAVFEDSGAFVLLSGLHQEAPDPQSLAANLASLFQGATGTGLPMRTKGSAISVSASNVGFVQPRNFLRAGPRLRCLHHNQALLLAYLQNLITLVPGPTTFVAAEFQPLAARVLNHLYRREPLQTRSTVGIYRSRLAELWLQKQGLTTKINTLTDRMRNPPPPLV